MYSPLTHQSPHHPPVYPPPTCPSTHLPNNPSIWEAILKCLFYAAWVLGTDAARNSKKIKWPLQKIAECWYTGKGWTYTQEAQGQRDNPEEVLSIEGYAGNTEGKGGREERSENVVSLVRCGNETGEAQITNVLSDSELQSTEKSRDDNPRYMYGMIHSNYSDR